METRSLDDFPPAHIEILAPDFHQAARTGFKIEWSVIAHTKKRATYHAQEKFHETPSSSMKITKLHALGSSLVLFLYGCRQLPVSRPSAAGTSSFAFIEPLPAQSHKSPNDAPIVDDSFEVEPGYFVEAKPLEPLTKPVYPPEALAGKAGLVTVGVRLKIDAEGRVTDVGPSMAAFSTPSRWAEQFQTVVRTAVMQWRFRPAQRYRIKPDRTNETDGSTTKKFFTENTETYLDLSFTFSASGAVFSGSSEK